VSGHERERLSAYLDAELPPGERTEVEAHLAGCPECASLLADMRAVDAAANGLPAEAPEGYFDAFPSRVVARLGAALPAPARTRRLPAWTWAAAAAVLLAVVAPLTLRHSAPGPASTTTASSRPAFEARDEKRERDAVSPPDATPVFAERPQPAPAPPPATALPAAPGGPTLAQIRLPAGKGGRNEAGPEAARVTLPPPAAPAEDEASRAKLADAPAQSGVREEPALAATEAFAESAREPARHAPAASTAPFASSARRDEGTAGAVSVMEPDRAFGRLEASRPRTAAQWRLLRDAWNDFAAAHSDDPRADEARVRAIESGREAWLAGGAGDDDAAFHRDARAYLEREDALQKERVERLLQAPRRP
jgi:hypothetical protein